MKVKKVNHVNIFIKNLELIKHMIIQRTKFNNLPKNLLRTSKYLTSSSFQQAIIQKLKCLDI